MIWKWKCAIAEQENIRSFDVVVINPKCKEPSRPIFKSTAVNCWSKRWRVWKIGVYSRCVCPDVFHGEPYEPAYLCEIWHRWKIEENTHQIINTIRSADKKPHIIHKLILICHTLALYQNNVVYDCLVWSGPVRVCYIFFGHARRPQACAHQMVGSSVDEQ